MAIQEQNKQPVKTILVLGDNRISASIAQALSCHGYTSHIVTQSKDVPAKSDYATYHHSDLTQLTLRPIFDSLKPDLLISSSSGGNSDLQRTIISTAVAAGIPRFMPAEFGHDSLNPAIQARLPPHRERGRVLAHLQNQSESGEIAWLGVATGSTLDHGLLSGDLGFELKWQSATLHGDGAQLFPASSTAWIGKAVAIAVEHWDAFANHYIYLAGMTTCGNDIVTALERATNQKWEVGRVDVEDTLREAEQRIAKGFPDAGMFLIARSVLYDSNLDAVRPFLEKDAKAQMGLEGERLESLVERIVQEYQHHGKADCGCV